jgi:Ca-activated chloride channel family protein
MTNDEERPAMHHWFSHPLLLAALGVLPLLATLALWNRYRRRRALVRLGQRSILLAIRPRLSGRRLLRNLCLLAGLVLLILGMAGPQWGRDWDQSTAPGRDLVVVLDCSRSMLAETPSRLERAHTALLDLVHDVEKRGGHRLALILFAGRAKLVCPLTHDYDHFRAALEGVEARPSDPDLAPGPGDESGTRIGLALHEAVLASDTRFQGARDILLLSDGDDPARDGEWREGADEARAQGIPVHTVGLGNPDQASPIRVGGTVLMHADSEVRTRLEEAPLREIAERTHGVYVPARTRAVPLGPFYLDLIAAQSEREHTDDALPVYQQRYPWALLPAFGLLILWTLVPEGPAHRGFGGYYR